MFTIMFTHSYKHVWHFYINVYIYVYTGLHTWLNSCLHTWNIQDYVCLLFKHMCTHIFTYFYFYSATKNYGPSGIWALDHVLTGENILRSDYVWTPHKLLDLGRLDFLIIWKCNPPPPTGAGGHDLLWRDRSVKIALGCCGWVDVLGDRGWWAWFSMDRPGSA